MSMKVYFLAPSAHANVSFASFASEGLATRISRKRFSFFSHQSKVRQVTAANQSTKSSNLVETSYRQSKPICSQSARFRFISGDFEKLGNSATDIKLRRRAKITQLTCDSKKSKCYLMLSKTRHNRTSLVSPPNSDQIVPSLSCTLRQLCIKLAARQQQLNETKKIFLSFSFLFL